MDKKLREMEEEQRKLLREMEQLKKESGIGKKPKHEKNILIEFLVGLVLLGVGLFWIFQSVSVTSSFGGFMRFGGFYAPNGTVIIPLLIGIIMLFLMERKVFGWIVTAIGIAVILIAIIMSVHLRFNGGSLYNYILMFGFTGVGGGLVIKSLFKK